MPRRTVVLEIVIVGAVSIVAALVWTWPLVLHLDELGRASIDIPFEAWTVDWVQYALFHQPLHLYDANIFAPEKGTLAFSAPLIGVAIPLLPFRWLGLSPLAVHNVGIILATAANAASAYLLGRVIFKERVAAVALGAAFAFGPFPYEKSQLQITARAGIPLAAAATWWLLDRAEVNGKLRGPTIALFAVMAWQTSVSMYPAVYALVAIGVVFLARYQVVRRRPIVLACAAAGLGGLLLFAIPHFLVARTYPEAEHRTPGDYGINLLGAAFPGFALLTVAVIGVFVARRWKVLAFGCLLVAVGLVMGVGTATHGWRRFAPYRVVYDYAPGVGSLRDFSRAWLLGILGLGVLAALAVAWLYERHAAAGIVLAVLVSTGCVAEGYEPWDNAQTLAIRRVDQVLNDQPPGGVVYLPLGSPRRADDFLAFFQQPEIVYRTTEHHRPTVNAYFAFFPAWSGESADLAQQLPCSFGDFYKRGIRYVVAGANVPRLHDAAAARPLELIGVYDGDWLYRIPDPAGATCRPRVR
jgi:hypothetical protein